MVFASPSSTIPTMALQLPSLQKRQMCVATNPTPESPRQGRTYPLPMFWEFHLWWTTSLET